MNNESLVSRFKQAWNVFMNRDPTPTYSNIGAGYYYRPDRPRFSRGNERSIVTSVYNRIALDVASVDIRHVKLDDNDRFSKIIDSGLNNCLSLEANLDQTSRAFIQDCVISMMDEGCIAIVPVDTKGDPYISDSYDILSLRVGKIIEWFPQFVKVRLYNEKTGRQEDITIPKRTCAIIENPLFAVINEPNSTMQRLIRKLNILDAIDEQSGSGKLDLIIQLPYVIKSNARRQQAEDRRADIEKQLRSSKYGIAYTDGTERITQLNRPVDNNLMAQIQYLTELLYSQLGITQSILDGTADEKTMLNYMNRSVEPIVSALVDEMKRKYLTKTARTQKPFGLAYRTLIGNDVDGESHGYKIHLAYGCTVSPSTRDHQTINESPEALEMSWEGTCTPVNVGKGFKPTSTLEIDSTKVSKELLDAVENILYGSETEEARLPLPSEIMELAAEKN